VKLPKFDDHLEKHDQRVKRTDKRKHHQRGFSEDVSDRRATRVNFKSYLRELEEEEVSLAAAFEPLTPAAKQEILADFQAWSGGSTPDECLEEDIRTYTSMTLPADYDPEEALEFLLNYAPEK
jgi:hypothetical protein